MELRRKTFPLWLSPLSRLDKGDVEVHLPRHGGKVKDSLLPVEEESSDPSKKEGATDYKEEREGTAETALLLL